MKELKSPTREEMPNFLAKVDFNEEENAYWKDMVSRRDGEFEKSQYAKLVNFYLKELESIKGKFGNRGAVDRRIKYALGEICERVATYESEAGDLITRSKLFEKAADLYQEADEMIGYLSDYALRQFKACEMAARCRQEAGLEDKTTYDFIERKKKLLENYFQEMQFKVVVLDDPDYEKVKKNFESGNYQKSGDVVKGYIPKGPEK